MPSSDPHALIARKLRSVESAKTELLQHVANVFRAVHTGSERELTRSLAGVIGMAYFLGVQVGIPPQAIDQEMAAHLPKPADGDALDPAGLESLQRYFDAKR